MTKIGFIGLGLMGSPMATRLLWEGYELSVYNRTREKAELLLSRGAHWCESPAAVATQSDIVFSMISTSEVLAEITLGKDGILQGLTHDKIHVDMSTVSPATTRVLDSKYRERGAYFMHVPVLGSIPQATDGSLLLFAGGDDTAYNAVEPLLRHLGKQIWKLERPELASHMKLLCNMFIAGMITTLVQALEYAQRAAVNPHTLLEVLAASQLNSPMYQTKGASILEHNFSPRFFLEHMLKDIDLMLSAALEIGAPLPAIEVTQELFVRAQQLGYSKEDYSAVMKALQRMGEEKT